MKLTPSVFTFDLCYSSFDILRFALELLSDFGFRASNFACLAEAA